MSKERGERGQVWEGVSALRHQGRLDVEPQRVLLGGSHVRTAEHTTQCQDLPLRFEVQR